MCKPDRASQRRQQQQPNPNDEQRGGQPVPTDFERKKVIVSGAGPAGLLLTALLMQRNKELLDQSQSSGQQQSSSPGFLYDVTLVDGRIDYGSLTGDELKHSHRSWMLGLAGHGLEALRTVDRGRMYEQYIRQEGIQVESFSIHLGTKEIKNDASTMNASGGEGAFPEGFIVDRNFIVAALARYIRQLREEQTTLSPPYNALLKTVYETKLMYVDYDHRRVLVRNKRSSNEINRTDGRNDDGGDADDGNGPPRAPEETEFYLDYDLLVGCDGVRSVAREALVKRHAAFEMDVGDIFQAFKAVHVAKPAAVDAAGMHLLPDVLPGGMQGIALPETGDMLNISIGVPRHVFDELPWQLKINDMKDVDILAEYLKEHFQAFELVDYTDFATQWIRQSWNRTGQVHCNFYHSNEAGIVIMGDAAHATSPSIGMGMNQALKDAQCFYQLLVQHKDDFDTVLPAFSQQRVKEGNALSDLALHLYCFDSKQQVLETIHMVVRGVLSNALPRGWVAPHPQSMIGLPKYTLADVYDHAHKLGIIPKHRQINQRMRQTYFERTTGMVKRPQPNAAEWMKEQASTLYQTVVTPVKDTIRPSNNRDNNKSKGLLLASVTSVALVAAVAVPFLSRRR